MSGSVERFPTMTLRDKLKKLLIDIGKKQSDLARAMEMTDTSVTRYFKWIDSGELDDDQWAEMVRGLRKIGAAADDIAQIRPLPKPKAIAGDLLPCLDAFTTRGQLEALITVLSSDDDEAKHVLRAAAEYLLRKL
jgi:hypothetical protein